MTAPASEAYNAAFRASPLDQETWENCRGDLTDSMRSIGRQMA